MSDPKPISYVEAVTKATLDAEYIVKALGDVSPFSPFADWVNDYTKYLTPQRRSPPNTP